MPHADTVVYSSDDTSIYFFADDGSSLSRNIQDSHYVSFTIDDYTTDWKKLRELQGVGRSTAGGDREVHVGVSLMAQKFGVDVCQTAGDALQRRAERDALRRLRLTRLSLPTHHPRFRAGCSR